MKALKSLTFAQLVQRDSSPHVSRRAKLVAHLEQQKALADDPLHMRTVHRWVIQPTGTKERVELKKRVRQWWRTDELGAVYLTVRYGAKAIEFEKGKTAILLKDKSQLIPTIDTVIAAVKAGELDEQLALHAKARGIPKAKRAA